MKKRTFGLFAAVLMLFCLLPGVALADETVYLLWQDTDGKLWCGVSRSSGTEWTDSNLTTGSYKLDSDITITSTINITGDVTLDLNGHVLKMTGTGSVIQVGNESTSYTFTLKDSNPRAVHKFDATNDLWVLVENDTTGTNIKTVTGGVITGGRNIEDSGGGVNVVVNINTNRNKMIMTGGNIVGCTAGYGGGVWADTFTMSGGSIVGCTATNGGGVCAGSFTMSGGSIEDCAAPNGSSGVNADTFTMSGGQIRSCSGSYCVHINQSGTISGTAVIGPGTNETSLVIVSYNEQEGLTANGGTIYGNVELYGEDSVKVGNEGTTTIYGQWLQCTNEATGEFVPIDIPGTNRIDGSGDTGTTATTFHTVRATAGAGGSLSETIVSLRPGESFTFEFTPDAGYAVADVKVDGKSVGAVESYTFRNLSADRTLEVEFVPIGSAATGTPADADKNPNTGAVDALGVAAGLAALSLVAAFAANKKH